MVGTLFSVNFVIWNFLKKNSEVDEKTGGECTFIQNI